MYAIDPDFFFLNPYTTLFPPPQISRLLLMFAVVASLSRLVAQQPPLAQPLAWEAIPAHESKSPTEYTGFSASGLVYEINHTTRNIAVISAKPFWAPKPHIRDRVALWPAGTLLIVHVPNLIPLTIDGKKIGFEQLTVGETISLQYSIYVGWELGCGAREIHGSSVAAPAKHSR